MSRAIVIAHHLIFTAYGWWLPNDPRGGMSRTIRSDVIAELGSLHHGRKRVQPAREELLAFFDASSDALKHERSELSDHDIEVVADAFSGCTRQKRYTCWACAIMPDHVHILIRKHRDQAEDIVARLQHASREALKRSGMRPVNHPVWGGQGWKVFLDSPTDVRRTIRYIENNPAQIGRRAQKWAFVRPYDDWPFHIGHNPRSPYVRALRAVGQYPK